MSDLYIKVQPPASAETGWQRPTEWVSVPTPENDELTALYLVFENERNVLAVSSDQVGDVFFDFENDGTEVAADGNVQTYTYDYANLGGSVSQYADDGSYRNYKQAIVRVRSNTTAINNLKLCQSDGFNINGSLNFAEVKINFVNQRPRVWLGKINLKNQRYLKIVNIMAHNIDSPTHTLLYLNEKENKTRPVVEQFTIPNNDLYAAGSNSGQAYQKITINHEFRDIYASTGGCEGIRIKGCRDIYCQSSFNGSTFASATLGFCRNIILTSTRGDRTFQNSDFQINGTINSTVPMMRNTFANNTSTKLIFTAIHPNPSNFSAFTGMGNLEELIVPGLEKGFNIANSNMGATALNAMFTSLGTANGTQTITVTGNPGAATCTTSIATNKGFTVVVS